MNDSTSVNLLFDINEISKLKTRITQIINSANLEELRVIYDWLSSNFSTSD